MNFSNILMIVSCLFLLTSAHATQTQEVREVGNNNPAKSKMSGHDFDNIQEAELEQILSPKPPVTETGVQATT